MIMNAGAIALALLVTAAGSDESRVFIDVDKDGLKWTGPCTAKFYFPGKLADDDIAHEHHDTKEPAMVPRGKYDMVVGCPSTEGELRAVKKIDARKDVEAVVKLRPGFALVFVERDGKPVSATVRVLDKNGRALAEGKDKVALPVLAGKHQVLAVVDKEDAGTSKRPIMGSAVVVVRKGKKSEKTIDTSDGMIVLSLSNNGKPAAGVGALRAPGSPDRLMEFASDTDAAVSPGTYDVVTTLSDSHDFAEVVQRKVTIRPGKTKKLRVAHKTGRIAPRLVLKGATVADGASAKIELFKGAAPAAFNTIAGGDEAMVSPGSYRLVATLEDKKADDGSPYSAEAEVKVRARKTANVTIDLTPGAVDVIALLGGKPHPLVLAAFKPGAEAPCASKTAGDDGKASFTLSPGRYKITATKKAPQGSLVTETSVFVDFGQKVRKKIDLGVGMAAVQVFDKGVAVPAEVLFFAEGAAEPMLGVPAGQVAYLPPGTYALAVRRKGVQRTFAPLTIGAGRRTERQVELAAEVQADTREGPANGAGDK
jgi:hypothetical protein